MEAMKKFEVDGKMVEIHADYNPSNPRTDWDNDDVFVCFHPRHGVPNETEYKKDRSWEELDNLIKQDNNVAAMLPVYMYDHSGQVLATTPFGCRWDSMRIGTIFISKENARKSHMVKRLNKKVMETVYKNLIASVEAYSQFMNGDIFGYIIKDKNEEGEEGEELDSCWGFYGYDYCVEQATEAAKVATIPTKEDPNQLLLPLTV